MDFNNYNEFNEDLRGNLINNFEFNIKNDVTDVLLTDPILFKYTAIDYGLLELNGLYDFFRQLLITYNYEEISYWRDISSIDTFVLWNQKIKIMLYKILNESFFTKNEIEDKCRNILNNNIGKPLTGDDLNFMTEIFKHYPSNRSKGFDRMCGILVKIRGNYPTFHIIEDRGSFLRYNDVSLSKALKNIHPVPAMDNIKPEDRIIYFGKYRGKSLGYIFENDFQYLVWLHNQNINTDKKILSSIDEMVSRGLKPAKILNLNKPSTKMDEFLKEIDNLCLKYGFAFYPTVDGWTGKKNKKGEFETFACIGNGEKVKLLYIDGDGTGGGKLPNEEIKNQEGDE